MTGYALHPEAFADLDEIREHIAEDRRMASRASGGPLRKRQVDITWDYRKPMLSTPVWPLVNAAR